MLPLDLTESFGFGLESESVAGFSNRFVFGFGVDPKVYLTLLSQSCSYQVCGPHRLLEVNAIHNINKPYHAEYQKTKVVNLNFSLSSSSKMWNVMKYETLENLLSNVQIIF